MAKPVSKTTGLLILSFVMLAWGSTFTITKTVIGTLPPFCFAFLRFTVASILLGIVFLIRRKKIDNPETPIPYFIILLMGISGVTIYYIFFNLSMVYTSASSGALIQGFIPVSIALLAVIFLKEKLTIKQIAGIVLSVIGVIMVGFITGVHKNAPDSFKGNLLMIGAILAWSVYTILSKKISHVSSLLVTCLSTFVGTVLLLPAVVFELWHKPLPVITPNGWFAIIYLGAIASALSFFLYNQALETLSASQIGVFINLDPIIGAIIAVMFLKEDINAWQIAGTLLVLGGVWLSSHQSKVKVTDGILS